MLSNVEPKITIFLYGNLFFFYFIGDYDEAVLVFKTKLKEKKKKKK